MATYINLTHEIDTIELHLLTKFNSQNALMEFNLNNVLPQKHTCYLAYAVDTINSTEKDRLRIILYIWLENVRTHD